MRSTIGLLCGVLVLAGCSGGASIVGLGGTIARDVSVTVTIPGRCVFTCDPPGGDLTTLALVTAVNHGATPRYVRSCGGVIPSFEEQDYIDGQWQFIGSAGACVSGPEYIVLAPGDSVQSNWFPPKTLSRITIAVATDSAFVDGGLAASRAVHLY